MQQARDRHGPNTAGHRRDRSCHGFTRRKIAVAHQFVFAVALDAVDADVDHTGAGLDPIAFHHFGSAHGGDDEVGPAYDGG